MKRNDQSISTTTSENSTNKESSICVSADTWKLLSAHLKYTKKAEITASIFLGLFLLLQIIIGIGIYKSVHRNKTDYYSIMRDKTDLEYWGTKYALVEEIDKYIKTQAPGSIVSGLRILENCDKYDLKLDFVLAMGHIESHFGTTGTARKTNSVWNVGAFDNGNHPAKFKYDSPNMSIEPYMKLIRSNYLGEKKTEQDLLKNFVSLSGHRYASYKNYEAELRGLIERINNTTHIDSLALRYSQLKSITGR